MAIVKPAKIFGEQRRNSKGWDITDPVTIGEINRGRDRYRDFQWQGGPVTVNDPAGGEQSRLAPVAGAPAAHVQLYGIPRTALASRGAAWQRLAGGRSVGSTYSGSRGAQRVKRGSSGASVTGGNNFPWA